MSILNVDLDEADMMQDTVEGLQKQLDELIEENTELKLQIREWELGVVWIKEECVKLGIPPFWATLPKPIAELTREELEKRNKEIPRKLFKRADSEEKIARPTHEQLVEHYKIDPNDNPYLRLAQMVFSDEDLEKYGIDRETMNFKPGYSPVYTKDVYSEPEGPYGKTVLLGTELVVQKPSMWTRIVNFLKS